MRYTESQLADILRKQGHPVNFTPKPERAKKRNEESRSQIELMEWWDVACLNWRIPRTCLMAFPLQGARTPRNGARMKREGCRKGTPDMLLAVARGGFHGMWLELKAPNGTVSSEQWDMIHALNEQGYATAVCYSKAEAQKKISGYLEQ